MASFFRSRQLWCIMTNNKWFYSFNTVKNLLLFIVLHQTYLSSYSWPYQIELKFCQINLLKSQIKLSASYYWWRAARSTRLATLDIKTHNKTYLITICWPDNIQENGQWSIKLCTQEKYEIIIVVSFSPFIFIFQ